jgi:hypothetical protein
MSFTKERSMSVFSVEVNRNDKVTACIVKVGGGDKSWGGNGCKLFGLQVARATEFCAMAPNIGGS